MSVTLILPGDDFPLTDPYDIRQSLEHEVDLIIDGGFCGLEPTTVIDMTTDSPELRRQGLGDASPVFELSCRASCRQKFVPTAP